MAVWYAGVITLVAGVLIVLVALVVASRQTPAPAEQVRTAVYRVRGRYFGLLVAAAAIGLGLTLRRTPYAGAATASPALTVTVDGMMWAWRVTAPAGAAGADGGLIVPVGQPVRFEVGAVDVNHGFAVYRPDGSLLGQTQAMPGYRNQLTLVFPEPGTYRVLCLEYCGVGHHSMFTSIQAR